MLPRWCGCARGSACRNPVTTSGSTAGPAPPLGAASCSRTRSGRCSRRSRTYGYRRIHAELLRAGEHVGAEQVRRLMRELGLVPVQPRPFRTTTVPDPDAPETVDLLRRDFCADRPGIKVVGDITFIRTWQGWLYLATLIDCFNREVIAGRWPIICAPNWSPTRWTWPCGIIGSNRIVLCIPTAVRNTRPPNIGTLTRLLRHSVADRSMLIMRCESFFASLKNERVHHMCIRHKKAKRHCPLHRTVLQSTTNSLRTRLPDTTRSPHRIPEFAARRINERKINSPENAGQPTAAVP